MNMVEIRRLAGGLSALAVLTLAAGCGSNRPITADAGSETGDGDTSTSTSTTSDSGTTVDTDDDDDGDDGGPDFDGGWQPDFPPAPECDGCVDIVMVIDNSGTMGEKQRIVGQNMPAFVDALLALEDGGGNLAEPSVQIMVTTTDMGHPNCTPFQPDGYEPAQGSPVEVACIDRLSDFTGLGSNPTVIEEACTDNCPVAKTPLDPFIHFSSEGTNVPGDDIKGTLQCIAPQGINGCGFESPLEAMLGAINPGAEWNQGNRPMLRDGSLLAVVLVTDEADCSVKSPDGYAFFTDPMFDVYWEVNPNTGTKTQATSAICWNSGVECDPPDQNGVYPDCQSVDNGVLHPIDRYLDYLSFGVEREVVMLGVVGVPSVTSHNPNPPFEPTSGGVEDLVYRQWKDGPWPGGDILPGDPFTAAEKEWEFGIGPGCTGADNMGGFVGQAIPPVRIKEVCQGLDQDAEAVRCCLESVCDTDYSAAFQCLAGVIQETLPG